MTAKGGDFSSMAANGGEFSTVTINGGDFRPPNLAELSQRLMNSPTLGELAKDHLSLVKLMTTEDENDSFREMLSRLNAREFHRIAVLVTTDSAFFLSIARNSIGSGNLAEFLGKFQQVDSCFSSAISHCFLELVTNKISSELVIEALKVFNEEKKEIVYEELVYHANYLACQEDGHMVLKKMITYHLDDNYRKMVCRDKLAQHSLVLSLDAFGHSVMELLLGENDVRYIIARPYTEGKRD